MAFGLLSRLARRRRPSSPPDVPANSAPPIPAGDGQRATPAVAVPGAAATPPRRRATPGQLRRERRALQRKREERIRDLGGLMLEMFRQDVFREDLVRVQCEELLALETRLHEIDATLAALAAARSRRSRSGDAAGLCSCGAPLVPGTHFCAHCGRPAEGDAPVVACAHCGHALPADSNFCAACGTAVELHEAYEAFDVAEPTDTRAGAASMPAPLKEEQNGDAEAASSNPPARAAAEPARDPWEA